MNNKMVRIVALVLVALMFGGVVSALIVGGAAAEGVLDVSATITPPRLEGPGVVEITITVVNNGAEALENVVLNVDGHNINHNLGSFASGEKKTFNISNFRVNEYELGANIPFVFYWTEYGQAASFTYPIRVEPKANEPVLEATRSASSVTGLAGDVITLKYTLKNAGTTDLFQITVSDPVIKLPVVEGLTLEEGSSVYTVEVPVELSGSLESLPTITAYTADGEELVQTLPALALTVVQPSMVVIVNQGSSSKSGTPLDVHLQNNGDVDLVGITVTDEKGAVLADQLAIAAGKSENITHVINDSQERKVVITAAGSVAGMEGKRVSYTSSAVTVTPFVSAEDIELTSEVLPAQTILSEPGAVEVIVKLTNSSPVDLQDFVLTESVTGYTNQLGALKIGTTMVTADIVIEKSCTLVFSAQFKDAEGKNYHFDLKQAAISVSEMAPLPESALPKDGMAGWVKGVLIFVVTLLVFAVVTLGIKLRKDRQTERERREADEIERLINRRATRSAAPAPKVDRPQRSVRETVLLDGFEENPPMKYNPKLAQSPEEGEALRRQLGAKRPEKHPVVKASGRTTIKPKSRAQEADDALFEEEFFDK